jgi:ubiquinone/menaquinone biosynthesis C-methylase UbiE
MISDTFGRDLTAPPRNTDDIVRYYEQSAIGYRLFHSNAGSIHMALNPDGVFSRDGYLGQPSRVSELIDQTHAQSVLELACGNGFNTKWLASKHPEVQFVGVDLTPRHVRQARTRAPSNTRFVVGDFEHLQIADETMDLVFVVESYNHAADGRAALKEARRVLRPFGLLVVFDGFRADDFETYDASLREAATMVESSMAVRMAVPAAWWIRTAASLGLALVTRENLSHQIMPNLYRFERLAGKFFRRRRLRRLIRRVLGRELASNAVAGWLMPVTVEAGIQQYELIVFRRDS